MAKKKATTPTDGVEVLKVTKAEAVRQTVAAGIEKPAEAVPHIKEKFGLDITPQMFSAYKTQAAKKANGSSRGSARGGSDTVSLEALVAVRKLTERYGVDSVKQLADLFR